MAQDGAQSAAPARQGAAVWLGLVAALLPAGYPLLNGHLPWRGDGLLHFYRLIQLAQAVREGVWLPRWLPDMAYGFGFPLFNYYAPLSYYLMVPGVWLGASAESVLRLGYLLALLTTGAGVFLWLRQTGLSADSATIAAIAAVYAPYVLVNLHHRGALAEAWGIAWLAVCLWTLARLAARGDRISLLLGVGAYAALLLSHNISALVGTPLLAAYAAWLAWTRPSGRRAAALRLTLLFGLGLGISAFFWLPALAERHLVQIERLVDSADFDYRNQFTTLSALLAWPPAADTRQVNPPLPLSAGWPALLLAAVAWLPGRPAPAARALRRPLTLALVALTVAMLPVSRPLWDALPLARFVQFPWRLLGPASLALAGLAGLGVARLPRPLRSVAAPAALLAFALFWLFPAPLATTLDPSTAGLIAFETTTGALGTTSAGDYLPVAVTTLPPPDALLAAYAAAETPSRIPRLDRSSLPDGARADEHAPALLTSVVTVDAPRPFTARFLRFYFPGWQVTVDGVPVPTRADGPHGLIAAPVPAGQHIVTLTFGSTPVRAGAARLSWLALLATVAVLAVRPMFAAAPRTVRGVSATDRRAPAAVAGVALVVLAAQALLLGQIDSPWRRSAFDGVTVHGAAPAGPVNFADRLTLLAYDAPATVAADAPLVVDLYWRAGPAVDGDYSIGLYLVDDLGRRYGQSDSFHPAGFPVTRWQPGEYARDAHRLALLPGTPPGDYTLLVTAYRHDTGARLEVRNAAGQPVGTTVTPARVTVTAPRRWPTVDELGIGRIAPPSTAAVRLLGVDPPPAAPVTVGNAVGVTLYWTAPTAPAADYTARLALLADGAPGVAPGTVVAEQPFAPGRADWPTRLWPAGAVVRDGRAVTVPPVLPDGTPLPPGRYRLVAGTDAPGTDPLTIAQLEVTVPERTFSAPFSSDFAPQSVGDGVALVGASAETTADGVAVTLVWRADRVLPVGYSAFVHLLDDADQIVAQSDQIPAGGARPTTGWVPGEFVTDRHRLPLPAPGRYRLAVGLYDAATNTRLGERIVLPLPLGVGR